MESSRKRLGSFLTVGPNIFCAPLVRGSELAFRMLVRRHGVGVCYTPMLKADVLVSGGKEERQLLEQCDGDHPLVAQLCGRDPAILAEAVRLVASLLEIDAFDLNLGCPQECAKEGRYGAFLQEEPGLAAACVVAMRDAAGDLPVFCKMRILTSVEDSITYAQCLQEAGCSLLAIHCRTRDAKHDGVPDYDHLAKVVASLRIPVIANGGIGSPSQARAVLSATGAAGVMVGTALLKCPRAFANVSVLVGEHVEKPPNDCSAAVMADPVDLALEYLDFAERYPPPTTLYIRKHLRWLFRDELHRAYQEAHKGWLNGDGKNSGEWRALAWNFLEQTYLNDLKQFREFVLAIAQLRSLPPHSVESAIPAFRAIRKPCAQRVKDGDDIEIVEEPSLDWLDL